MTTTHQNETNKGNRSDELNENLHRFYDGLISADELLALILDELMMTDSGIDPTVLVALWAVQKKVRFLNDFHFEATVDEINRINRRILERNNQGVK